MYGEWHEISDDEYETGTRGEKYLTRNKNMECEMDADCEALIETDGESLYFQMTDRNNQGGWARVKFRYNPFTGEKITGGKESV